MHDIQRKLLEISKSCNLGCLSLRKVAKLIGEKHPQKIKFHLMQLERKGFIKVDRKRGMIANTAEMTSERTELVSVPILGSANCGEASLYAEERIEGFLKVSKKILKRAGDVFAIRAVGNSMNRASVEGNQIDNGDYVIVDGAAKCPSNGDYIVSVIDGMANIKKIMINESVNEVVLFSESDQELAPIYLHRDDLNSYFVCGQVVQVLKQPTL